MMTRRLGIAGLSIVLMFAAAGCGGGGGGSSPAPTIGGGASSSNAPTGSGTGSKAAQSVQLNVHIPGSSTTSSATRRSPQFVASSTQGVLVVVYATSDTGHTTPLGSSATNVAPGSTACGGASGARTCTVTIPAPPGQDDFVFTTYDQPPTSGTTFPSNANVLAKGTVTNQTINVASANAVNVTLSGALATTQANPYTYNALAGIGPLTYTLEFNAYDAGGNVIIGPYVDASGNPNPITVTVVETGGSGFTKVAVDGGSAGETAVVNSSSDIVTVSYTGGGSPGYLATLQSVSASGASLSPTFAPAFISSTSPAWTGGSSPQLNFTTPGQSATITIAQANATSAYGYNVNQSFNINQNCAGVVSFTNPGPGPSESFTITGGSAGGSCVLTLYLGPNVVDNIAITAPSNTSANVAVPGSLLAYTADGPNGVGIRTAAGQTVGGFATTSNADNIALDNAGNVYVLSDATGLTKWMPSATGYPPTYTNSGASYNITNLGGVVTVEASADGEVVVNEVNATNSAMIYDIWDPGKTGAPSRTLTLPDATGNIIYFSQLRSNGDLYVSGTVACGTGNAYQCVQYEVIPEGSTTPSRTFLESIVPPANQATFTQSYATVGYDGTLYVGEYNYKAGDPLAGIYIYPPSGPERYVSTGATAPAGIDVDQTGNIYVADNNSTFNAQGVMLTQDSVHTVNVVSPDGSTILRSINVLPGPASLVVNGDGTVFVSDAGVYSILPSAYTATQIDTYSAYDVVLYNGSSSRMTLDRTPLSIGSGSAHGGFAVHRRRLR